MATGVETLGADLRTRTEGIRNSDSHSSGKLHMGIRVRKLLGMGGETVEFPGGAEWKVAATTMFLLIPKMLQVRGRLRLCRR